MKDNLCLECGKRPRRFLTKLCQECIRLRAQLIIGRYTRR